MKIMKKIFMLVMLSFIFIVVGCKETSVEISITASKTTVQKGDKIDFTVDVTGTENKGFKWTISDSSLISIDISYSGEILKNVAEDTVLTITVTADADTSKTDSVEITVQPMGSQIFETPTLTLTADKTEARVNETIELAVSVENSDDTAYTIVSKNTEYVTVTGNTATVVKEPTIDLAVTLTATLNSNQLVNDSVTITVKAPVIEGQVGELTSDMLQEVGNASITVTGTLTDYYEDFNNHANDYQQSYEMKVLMDEGVWSGTWYPAGEEESALTDVYRKGSKDGVEDQYGNTGHEFLETFINKNNQVENKPMIDYMSYPVVWEAQHLYNHLGQLNITKFTYDAVNLVYKYSVETEEDMYLMTYLSYCLTPLLGDTLVEFYLKVEDGEITKIIAQTEQILQYGESATDIDARSYTRIELELSDIGTTRVPEPTPYAAGEKTDILAAAIEKMAALENYTFKVKDVTTSAPSTDEGDYTIESLSVDLNASSDATSKKLINYTSSVGTVGRVGYVTSDAVVFEDTGKYSYTMDGKSYHVSYSGYKQNSDNTYDEFEYSSDENALVGKKLHTGNISDILPGFDFSANVFELVSEQTVSGVTRYTYQLREDAITRDIALEISAYSYADDAKASSRSKTRIVVDQSGYIVETSYPYDLVSGTYLGTCTTTYLDFNTTVIPEGAFDDYVPRQILTSWSEVLMRYYRENFSTLSPDVEIGADVVIEQIFGEDAVDVPEPSLFVKLFGDNLNGPFYNWKEISKDSDGNPVNRAYFNINSQSRVYDENGNLNQEMYEEFAQQIIATLAEEGFVLDNANSQMNHRSRRFICMIKDNVQIVIENNGTKHFWIYFYVTGDWTLNR